MLIVSPSYKTLWMVNQDGKPLPCLMAFYCCLLFTPIGKKMEQKSYASSPPARRHPAKEDNMSKTDTRIVLDLKNLPPLTEQQKAQIERLKNRNPAEIDLSDMPEVDDSFWQTARRGDFYRPMKESVTVRLDTDVLAWLKSSGKGYQTRINAILRQAMLKEIKK
jgi:uncharacterized protein (DUF4415 family)